MGSLHRWNKKSILLTKPNIFLLFYLIVVLLATMGPFVILCLGKNVWMDYYLSCSPFFVPTFYLSALCTPSAADYASTVILVGIVYYSLWGIVTLSAILAVVTKGVWKYVPYLLFILDAFLNLIVPHIAVAVDIAMIMLLSFSLTQVKGYDTNLFT